MRVHLATALGINKCLDANAIPFKNKSRHLWETLKVAGAA